MCEVPGAWNAHFTAEWSKKLISCSPPFTQLEGYFPFKCEFSLKLQGKHFIIFISGPKQDWYEISALTNTSVLLLFLKHPVTDDLSSPANWSVILSWSFVFVSAVVLAAWDALQGNLKQHAHITWAWTPDQCMSDRPLLACNVFFHVQSGCQEKRCFFLGHITFTTTLEITRLSKICAALLTVSNSVWSLFCSVSPAKFILHKCTCKSILLSLNEEHCFLQSNSQGMNTCVIVNKCNSQLQ